MDRLSTDLIEAKEKRESEVFGRVMRAITTEQTPEDANPLHDPELVAIAQQALKDARGPNRDENSGFHYSLWSRGVYDNGKPYWLGRDDDGKWHSVPEGTPGAIFKHTPGRSIDCTVALFVRMLHERSAEMRPKGKGWVIQPTTNPTGVREAEATTEMHALFLDCDGNGTWDRLLDALDALGYGYVAYQSGGHTPAIPKWRVVLLFSAPVPVATPDAKAAWQRMYNRCRVAFGAIGGLRWRGFDWQVTSVGHSWYVTERREIFALPREVRFHPGASLDYVQLALALPIIEDDAPRPPRPPRERGPELEYDESRIEAVVEAIDAEIESIHTRRRKLCFALTDALMDFGFTGDDSIDIIDRIWSRYATDAAEAAHRIAQYVVDKWDRGDETCGAGDLAKNWPVVMAALKEAIPDVVEAHKQAWLASEEGQEWRARKQEEDRRLYEAIVQSAAWRQQAPTPPPLPPEALVGPPPLPPPSSVIERLDEQDRDKWIERCLKSIRAAKIKKEKKIRRMTNWGETVPERLRQDYVLLSRVISKSKPQLAPANGTPDPETGLNRMDTVERVASLLGFIVSFNAPWEAIEHMLHSPLSSLSAPDVPLAGLVDYARITFTAARERAQG